MNATTYTVEYEGAGFEDADVANIRKLVGTELLREPSGASMGTEIKIAKDQDGVRGNEPFFVNTDESDLVVKSYELKAALAELIAPDKPAEASSLYSDAAELAMADGKAQLAMKYLDN